MGDSKLHLNYFQEKEEGVMSLSFFQLSAQDPGDAAPGRGPRRQTQKEHLSSMLGRLWPL
jgi:hypothetical protein